MKRPTQIPLTIADLPEHWAAWARFYHARWWWPPNRGYASALWAASYTLRKMLRANGSEVASEDAPRPATLPVRGFTCAEFANSMKRLQGMGVKS